MTPRLKIRAIKLQQDLTLLELLSPSTLSLTLSGTLLLLYNGKLLLINLVPNVKGPRGELVDVKLPCISILLKSHL